MKRILFLITACVLALSSCKVSDNYTVTVKRKAVVHFLYHYDRDGHTSSLDDVQSLRLFIYDAGGRLYRDTTVMREAILADMGVLQTYLSKGDYTFVSWVNLGNNSTPMQYDTQHEGVLQLSGSGSDCLMYGMVSTPIVKGDSLFVDVNLFKSVFKINVTVEGLEYVRDPEWHYFALQNRRELSFYNDPCGTIGQIRPVLVNDGRTIHGSFYTPYFRAEDDLTLGVYHDVADSPHTMLVETTIRQFCAHLSEQMLGRDIEIDVKIEITPSKITIYVTDWDGQVIQEEHIGR